MRVTEKPHWLNYLDIIAFYEDGDDDKGDEGKEGDGKEGDDDGDDDKGAAGGDEGKKDNKGGEDTSGLKSALDKERADRKKLDKELRELKKFKEDLENKDKSEAEKAKAEADKSTEKVAKLAVRLRTTALESAIAKAAQKANFRDVDDALGLVKRDSINVEQDEEDPAEIEIDEKSVERAVKALADAKPHLLVAEGDRQPSGGKFNGKKNDSKTSEEAFRTKYPALRRGRPTS